MIYDHIEGMKSQSSAYHKVPTLGISSLFTHSIDYNHYAIEPL